MDTIAKYLSSDLSFLQITWARYFFTVSFTETLIYSLTRVLIGPIVGFGFVKFFNLSGIEAGVMFIQTSMPSAVLTYLIAEMYSPKKIVDNIASVVVLSTFLSFVTIPIVVFLALKYFS